MNGSLASLLSELRRGLQALYEGRLEGLYLYGSYARGDYDEESDVDVLIVLDRVDDYGVEIDRSSEVIACLSLEYGVTVIRVIVSLDNWLHEDLPFYHTVREDALPV